MPELQDKKTYIPTIQESLSEKYDGTYFSGAQCEIWIGNYHLDEAVEIEGVYNMEHIPIYGYNSRHFNTAVGGRVIVNAALIINYKYEGYLYAYIKAAKEKQSGKNILNMLNNKFVTGKQQVTTQNPTDPSMGIDKEVINVTTEKSNVSKADIIMFQNELWGKSNKFNSFSNTPRQDFIGPFNIKIKDFKIGYSKDSSTTEKELINCFVNRYATVRRVDGTPLVEVYTLIAMSLL